MTIRKLGILANFMILSDFYHIYEKYEKMANIHIFEIVIFFYLYEIWYRYIYEKASKNLGECVFGGH